MWNAVEGFGEVWLYGVDLLFFVHSSGQVIDGEDELGLARPALTKAMPAVGEDAVSLKVGYDA